MDGQRLYEERVLELVMQSVMLSAKPVTNRTAALYFVSDATVTPLQKLENQGNDAHLPSGSNDIEHYIITGEL